MKAYMPARSAPLMARPAPWMTSEPGSFAHNTLKVRVPAILRDVLRRNNFPARTVAALEALYDELTAGVLRPLAEDAPDRALWDAAAAPWVGCTWLDVPWYFAEAYFYRRVLQATGYFQPGPGHAADPYAVIKRADLAPAAAPAAVAVLLDSLPAEPAARFERLLHASLWGNRTDLSYAVAAHLGNTASPAQERHNLLVDDAAALWATLARGHKEHIVFITDNAGAELLADLALIHFLLVEDLADEVHLHLKPQPFFVSDATIGDLAEGLDALLVADQPARSLAWGLEGHMAARELQLAEHWFYASSLFYDQMPADLWADLAGADLVIVKGDANYRRLLGDAHWPPTTPFAEAVGAFPAPLVALRTLKSELIVGLPEGRAEQLTAEDPTWQVNGRRGVIQASLAK